ncbi:MAG: isoleucyl-tRNA synthetase [Candidatus Diapherotrites archaeon]|nr:isoleucyl-tRNA synthetase [Candidatus Diapherotrites archaeon]MDN5366992.1 isoleucyl-tRNA synthetase [Candidatus Diapherotrites archaeon]
MSRYSKEVEEEVRAFWEKNDVYKKAKEQRKDGKPFFFMDGPPYATGRIHLGTAWNKILKDVYIRYYRMNGYDVFDRPGFDTHGTPIENKVEKKLGVSSKKEIEEKVGVENFVNMCKEFATEHIDAMTEQFKNLGVWMDWENPYITLRDEYIESGWWTFKKAYERGLLYKGKYPVHVCPHCGTVVSFAEVEYTEKEDPSVYVAFPVEGKENEFLLVWTTTPWTLVANVAIMAHPTERYVRVRVGDRIYILAETRLEPVAQELGWEGYEVLEEFPGKELEGLKYRGVLEGEVPKQREMPHVVVMSERYVSMEDGTGLVHSAPGHGREDFLVGQEYGLPVFSPVRIDGTYTEDAGKYAGMFVKDADKVILQDLEKKGLLVHASTLRHQYPICWRCKTPLLFISVDEWFYKVSDIKDEIKREAEKVKWTPEWATERFKDWVDNLRDWPISRQRFWGIPTPIWICDKCGHVEVIGSKGELLQKAVKLPEHLELHRPWVDQVVLKCPKCGGEMHRTPDVLDVWFDSGITTWAALGYPKNEELFKRYWPADLEIEGVDQVRGWWNSQMITSVIVFDRRPFENVVMHGFVLDVHGIKMSKSLGNVVAPEDVIEKYTRDTLRAYMVSRPVGEDIRFDWEEVKQYYTFLNTYWNLAQLLKRYVDQFHFNPEKDRTSYLAPEDVWILSRLQTVTQEVNDYMERHRHDKAFETLKDFILEDFSRTYVKLVRERMKLPEKDPSKVAAYQTIYDVLKQAVVLTAPFVPFISEKIYQDVVRPFGGPESVHLIDYPEPVKFRHHPELEDAFDTVMAAAEAVLAARHDAGIRLRWPVQDVVLVVKDRKPFETFRDAFLRYVNAKELRFTDSVPEGYVSKEFDGGVVAVPSELSEDVYLEALAREVLRRIQNIRKKLHLLEKDRIIVEIWGSEEIRRAVKEHGDLLRARAGIEELVFSEEQRLEGETVEENIEGNYVRITVRPLGNYS